MTIEPCEGYGELGVVGRNRGETKIWDGSQRNGNAGEEQIPLLHQRC